MDPLYLIAFFVFLLAGSVKGLIGIGLPTVTISLLSQITDPRIAIALGFVPIILTNVWQIYRAGEFLATLRRFGLFAVTLSLGIWFVSSFALQVSREALLGSIGISIVLFALASLIKDPPRIPDRLDKPAQITFGTIASILGGLTAIWAPAMVIYFLMRRVKKDDFVRGVGLLILAGAIPLSTRYLTSGVLTPELLAASAVMLIPALIGFSIGERFRHRLNQAVFEKVVLVMFLLLGLNLFRQAVF